MIGQTTVDVLCVGEMVIDFLPGEESGCYIRNAGGAPANVAIAVARNGLRSGFLGKVGDDDFGRFLISVLEENGVENVCKEMTKEAVTTMAFVTLHEGGERSFTFARKPGADMLLSPFEVRPELIDQYTVVHAGSCSLSRSPAAEATIRALKLGHEHRKLVSFDVNYRNLLWDNDEAAAIAAVKRILGYVDLLKISEEEVALFGGEAALPQLMRDNGITLVVETLGADGARCFLKDEVIEVEGRKAVAVDATGAGDAFWGGFLSCLLDQGVTDIASLTSRKIRLAMEYGNVAGWVCVQSKGAISSLPTKDQILKHLTARIS